MNTKFSSSLSDNQVPHCKYIILQAVTKVQQIKKKKKKKSFPYMWNFSPKRNLSELKDLEKLTTAELKRFSSLTCKSVNYCKCFVYENGNARIYW